jgi:predicted nucleic acid-binding protein
MPTGDNRAALLIDTSVAVALVVADHEHHGPAVEAVGARVAGLAGHTAFETFSVLTRLPRPLRLTPAAAAELLARDFPASRFLGADAARRLLRQLSPLGIAGGAVYDALVGATAVEHHLPLASRDRRAIETYRALQVDLEVLP